MKKKTTVSPSDCWTFDLPPSVSLALSLSPSLSLITLRAAHRYKGRLRSSAQIGKGKFSIVYSCVNKKTKIQCAAKVRGPYPLCNQRSTSPSGGPPDPRLLSHGICRKEEEEEEDV